MTLLGVYHTSIARIENPEEVVPLVVTPGDHGRGLRLADKHYDPIRQPGLFHDTAGKFAIHCAAHRVGVAEAAESDPTFAQLWDFFDVWAEVEDETEEEPEEGENPTSAAAGVE